jgi:hypothetical protein
MAGHDTPEYGTAAGNDYTQHQGTYGDFLQLVKWCVIVVTAILLGMWIFLA